eukprot:TRINITY_DN96699_c0_g1_i1.p1 TRINITY_DN96699_c0_g1~~TRINITY_DN96699_c0_g1_i1.p1  ORF type:complete len:312 (+),score=26.70 TRINITY_DN96699_c0_g1_i1:96-1031(+)
MTAEKLLDHCRCLARPRCAVITTVLAVITIGISVLLTVLWFMFTPVYEPMSCTFGSSSLKGVDTHSGGIDIKMSAETVCQNPNWYTLKISPGNLSHIYLGPVQGPKIPFIPQRQIVERTHVGEVTDIEDAELPAISTGSINTVSKITMSDQLIAALLPALLEDLPLELSLNLIVEVNVGFPFASWKTSVAFEKACGMYIAGLPKVAADPEGARLGPMACADSFEELTLPPISASEESGYDMGFHGGHLAPTEIEEGTRLKNLSLGVALAVAYSLSVVVVCIVFPIVAIARFKTSDSFLPTSDTETESEDSS